MWFYPQALRYHYLYKVFMYIRVEMANIKQQPAGVSKFAIIIRMVAKPHLPKDLGRHLPLNWIVVLIAGRVMTRFERESE